MRVTTILCAACRIEQRTPGDQDLEADLQYRRLGHAFESVDVTVVGARCGGTATVSIFTGRGDGFWCGAISHFPRTYCPPNGLAPNGVQELKRSTRDAIEFSSHPVDETSAAARRLSKVPRMQNYVRECYKPIRNCQLKRPTDSGFRQLPWCAPSAGFAIRLGGQDEGSYPYPCRKSHRLVPDAFSPMNAGMGSSPQIRTQWSGTSTWT